jgi:hypothetical protein
MGDVLCLGCGARVPETTGPVHAYMLAAPGCWGLYGTLLEWQASLPPGPSAATTSQFMVDAYAAQHATNPDRRNRQSVAVHLMSLCAALERGVPGIALRRLMGRWTHREYQPLLPLPTAFAITVADVAAAGRDAWLDIVSAWANATWAAWSSHQPQVRTWLNEAMAGPQAASRRGRR